MNEKINLYKQLKEQLPLRRNSNFEFVDFVNSTLQLYLDIVKSEYCTNPEFNLIKHFIEGIEIVYKKSLEGELDASYNGFKELFNPLISENEHGYTGLLPVINRSYKDLYELDAEELNYYFRLTKFEDSIVHLPFEKLSEIKSNNRFTAPNIPSFYGGNSISTCVAEIGGVTDKNSLVSCFEIDYGRSFILDLTMPAVVINQPKEDFLDKYILSWPVIALCMMRKGQLENENLIPEYLIPQFVLRLLAEHNTTKIEAVRYYSTKFEQISDSYINIAVPIKSEKESGYCDSVLNFFKDDDRGHLNPNYLRVTAPQTLNSYNVNYKAIEELLKHRIYYQKDLLVIRKDQYDYQDGA